MPGKTDSGYSFVYSLKRSGWDVKVKMKYHII
jgi:hypothetical protein